MSDCRSRPGSWNDPIGGLFKKPRAEVIPDTSREDSERELKKRKRRLRVSREAFQTRVSSLGPIQLQAPSLGGL